MIKKALTLVAPPEEKLLAGSESIVKDAAVFGGCCCRGKVTAELRLPKKTYVPGEGIYANLDVDNRHPRHIVDSVGAVHSPPLHHPYSRAFVQVEVRLVDRVRRVDSGQSAVSPYRTLLYRRLEQADIVRSKQTLHRDNLFLLTLPSVPPSTPGKGSGSKTKPSARAVWLLDLADLESARGLWRQPIWSGA